MAVMAPGIRRRGQPAWALCGPRRSARGRRPNVGHATTLLEFDGVRILTDPVLRSRVAHLHRLVPVETPGAAAMGRLEGILVSHCTSTTSIRD